MMTNNDHDDDREVEVEEEEDAASRAYKAITAQLAQFTSPHLSGPSWRQPLSAETRHHHHYRYDQDYMEDIYNDNDYVHGDHEDTMDAVEWMQHDLQTTSPPPPTPRRTPILERACTPVMSNSSSKRQDDEEMAVVPMTTPTGGGGGRDGRGGRSTTPLSSPRVTTNVLGFSSTTTPTNNTSGLHSPLVFRRYHAILATYLTAKRSLTHSLDLERQSVTLESTTGARTTTTTPTTPTASGSSISALVSREQRIELEYLLQLQLSSRGGGSSSSLEGDCWRLLVGLRQLGLHALIWEDDSISERQYTQAIQGFIQPLVRSIHETPERILQRLTSREAPLVLQRRYALVQWIQACLDQVRTNPPPARPAVPGGRRGNGGRSHPDDPPMSSSSLVPEDSFIEACLDLVLAGRVQDAQEVARSQGQPWRAAVWGGGKPHGVERRPNPQTQTIDMVATGNPHRFLWKRQMHKTARCAPPLEATISALLANDVPSCLSSLYLRDWSKAVGAVLMSMWGRLEDEVLVQHNTERRKEALPFDGTQHPQKEQEHLLSTAQLSGMNERRAMLLLRSSPFEELKGQGLFERTMVAFLEGKSSIMEYCKRETALVSGQDGHDENDDDIQLVQLRFLTHLMCFLESLQVSTTPIILSNLTKWNNQVLSQYVRYLESRPELWTFVTLYVSLLPDQQRLEWFPSMLAKVLEETERQSFLRDMQLYFPEDVLPILRRTVRLCLNSQSAPDEVKVQSLRWWLMMIRMMTTIEENENPRDSVATRGMITTYANEAMICSNLLLRQFFVEEEDDRLDWAMKVVDEILPEQIVAQCESAPARVEHLAFVAFLEAYRTFSRWKEQLIKANSTSPAMDDGEQQQQMDTKNLLPAEQEIVRQRAARDWLKRQRERCQVFVEAAEHARKVLLATLTYPGGWMANGDVDEEDENNSTDEEERKRRRDMEEIQSRYLALSMNLYHEVCEETASWLYRMFHDSVSSHTAMNRNQTATEWLTKEPLYQPSVWYQHALDLAILVADDRYGIHQAIGSNSLQEILGKLAETAVSNLTSRNL